jgi:hypothetical protein
MSSVMYTPGPSNRGPSNRGRSSYSRSHRSAAQKTSNIRVIAGLWTIGSVVYGAYFSYQLISLISGGIGGVVAVSVMLVSAGAMTFLAFLIFKSFPGRGVRAVTYICIGCVALSTFLIPGLVGLLTVICVGVTVVGLVSLLLYVAVTRSVTAVRLSEYKWVAVVIAGIPVIGAFFYVPATLSDAGLTVTFSQASVQAAAPSPIASQLSKISSVVTRSYVSSAVLSYSIRNNRLYADICKKETVQSIELNTAPIVQTPIPWLKWNLSRKLDRYLAADNSGTQLATLLSPVATALSSVDTVMVADGVLVNHPQQSMLPGKRVLRSISLDESKIGQNVQKWAEPRNLKASDVAVVNAIPVSQDELERLDIAGAEWPRWRGLHEQFERSAPRGVSKAANATKAQALDALQTKKGVMFIVAHYDGYSIRLPNGESLGVFDLDFIHDAISRNHPRVFLFSCETARLQNAQSFAKALLDHGAEAVVASTTPISASDALTLFRSFLQNALGPRRMPISEAFQRAQDKSNAKSLEVWIADLSSPRESGLQGTRNPAGPPSDRTTIAPASVQKLWYYTEDGRQPHARLTVIGNSTPVV